MKRALLIATLALLAGTFWSSKAQAYPCSVSTPPPYETGVPFGGYEIASASQDCPANSYIGTMVVIQQWTGSVWTLVAQDYRQDYQDTASVVAYNYWGCCAHYRAVDHFYVTISGVNHDYGVVTGTFDSAAWSVL